MFEFLFVMYYFYYFMVDYRYVGLDVIYFMLYFIDDILERLECVLYLINLVQVF